MKCIRYFYILPLFLLLLSCSVLTSEDQEYTLQVSASPKEGGNITPEGVNVFKEGEEVELIATPDDSYTFTGWSGDIESSSNPLKLTSDQDYEITANFKIKSYELSIEIEGEGTVAEEIIPQKTAEHEHGTQIKLIATPAAGYGFFEWKGDLSGNENSVQITIDEAKSITAVFKEVYTVDRSVEGNGKINIKPQQEDFFLGAEVEISAIADEGWEFTEWTGDITGKENPSTITIDGNKEVKAVFEKQLLSIETNTQGMGEVEVSPKKDSYEYNEKVTFTAISDSNSVFIRWAGDLSGSDNPKVINIKNNIEADAVFKTLAESFTYRKGGGVFINGRVHSASLQLHNTLPEDAELIRITLKNEDGRVLTENTDGATIKSGNGINFSLSFGIPPIMETFDKYTIEWEVQYKGRTVVITNTVGEGQSAAKMKQIDMPVIEIQV